MGLKKRQAPELRATKHETLWIGDDAVNVADSNLVEWCKTGDANSLVLHPGVEPTWIKYRKLTDREKSQLPHEDGTTAALFARCYEACRYGLVSVQGMRLNQRTNSHGFFALTNQGLEELDEFRAEFPFGVLVNAIYEARGVELPAADETNVESSLAVWVGGQILAATFRAD